MRKILMLGGIALLALGLLAGCGSKEKTVLVDEDTKAVISEEDGEFSMTVEDEEAGTMTMQSGENLSLPANWPEGQLPLYGGSEVVFVINNFAGDTEKESAVVAIGCDASIDDVAAFYKGKLSGATNFSVMEMNDYVMLSGIQGNVGFTIAVSNDKESGWAGKKDYPAYALLTYYQP